MSGNDENNSSMDELSKLNLTFYESSIELWRVEEKCRLKVKSIEEINNSTEQVTVENEWIEKQLGDTKSRINEVREEIVSIDNIAISLNETLAHLEIQHEKKKFIVNKSKCEYELQLFIRMELYQKEEERLNDIPEVKLLKIADTELKNTKLEYEKLLLNLQNLIDKIHKATKENDEKQNHIILQYAKVYIEMLSLNKREENCKTLLRKLNTEYNEKYCMKNILLESQKKKINGVSFWSYTPSRFESNIFDMKLSSLSQNLKPHIRYPSNYDHANVTYDNDDMNIKDSKLSNKPKKNVTFRSSFEDKISLETSDENIDTFKNVDAFIVEANKNISNNSAQLKNIFNVEESTVQFTNNDKIESKNMCFENKEKHMNDGDLDSHTNKRKTIGVPSDIEFKKPYTPVQHKNLMNSKIIQPSKMKSNKNIHMDNNFNQEKVKASSSSMDSYIHHNKNSSLDKDHLQKCNSLKSIELPNLKNLDHDIANIFDDFSQFNENVSLEQNRGLSDSFWNFNSEPISQNSANSSFCEVDLSESFENSDDISQYPDNILFNFSNSLNSNSNVSPESNFQGLETPQQFGNCMIQPSQSETFKKMNTNKNITMNRTTPKASNDYTQPKKSNVLPPDQFRFNFS